MNNEEAFGLPIKVMIGGQEIEFHRLDVDDLLKWANEVKQKRRIDEEARVRADQTLKKNEELQQRLIQDVVMREVEFIDLWRRTFTPVGARKVLIESLRKGGKSDGEVLAILKGMHWAVMQPLAEKIMTPPKPEKGEGQEKASPLTASDTAGTSPPSELLSPDSVASQSPDV